MSHRIHLFVRAACLAVVISLGAPLALAHGDPGSTTYDLLVPNDVMSGQITFVTLIGPPAGDEVIHTTWNLNFTSPPGGTPASDVLLKLKLPVDGGFKEWDVHGFDLGWPSSTGSFSGSIDSDMLNGVLDGGFFPFSTPGLDMGAIDGGLTGQFTESTITLEIAGKTTCQTDLGSGGPGNVSLAICGDPLASGGTATLDLEGAPAFAPVHFVVSAFSLPTAFKGGTLVPVPVMLTFSILADGAGAVTMPVPGGGGPAMLFLQAVVPDGAQPQGYAISNALQVDLLP
jgi:hypothetical protein